MARAGLPEYGGGCFEAIKHSQDLVCSCNDENITYLLYKKRI